jgi:3-hydroxybutyryl-CoA dehydrogenase
MQAKDVRQLVIGGAGIMGTSIAQIFAKYGYNVVLYDISAKSIENGKKLIAINQETAITEGEIKSEDSEMILNRISFSMDIECFRNADFVIEAIVEDMKVKHDFWDKVSKIALDDAILTTNTSGLSITEIAKAVKNPERFAGMHWVNPPHIVPLVEVICGEKSDPAVAETIAEVARKIGKKPVMVKKDAQGFILNRLQFCILREAMHIVESGIADIKDVDAVMKYGLGMRYACLGPFEVADLGGLDTFFSIASYLFADLSDMKEPPKMFSELIDQQFYGTKSGRGFYDYSDGRAEKVIEKRDKDFIKIANCLYK